MDNHQTRAGQSDFGVVLLQKLMTLLAQRVEDHIYSLFAGVLIDSGWCFDATRAFFNRLCLPFFASFVGKYEQDRLMPILEPVAANRKLQLFLACSMVGHRLQRGGDGLYRALGEIRFGAKGRFGWLTMDAYSRMSRPLDRRCVQRLRRGCPRVCLPRRLVCIC